MSLFDTRVMSGGLPAEVESSRVVANVRLRQELVGAEVEATVFVDLGIETGVFGPRVQVATGERERRAVEAPPRDVSHWHAEAHRELPELREARVLVIADVGAHQTRDVARLLIQWRGFVIGRAAVAEADAAEALGVVEQLLTAAVIEERAYGDVLVEGELGRERQLVAREGRAEVDGRVTERDFARWQRGALGIGDAVGRLAVRAANDPVAVLVAVAQDRHRPVAA